MSMDWKTKFYEFINVPKIDVYTQKNPSENLSKIFVGKMMTHSPISLAIQKTKES